MKYLGVRPELSLYGVCFTYALFNFIQNSK